MPPNCSWISAHVALRNQTRRYFQRHVAEDVGDDHQNRRPGQPVEALPAPERPVTGMPHRPAIVSKAAKAQEEYDREMDEYGMDMCGGNHVRTLSGCFAGTWLVKLFDMNLTKQKRLGPFGWAARTLCELEGIDANFANYP